MSRAGSVRHLVLGIVPHVRDSLLMRAVGAAVEGVLPLDSVADYPAATVRAYRRQLVNRTLEGVEGVGRTRRDHLEGQVIVVAAHFTLRHGTSWQVVVRSDVGMPTRSVPSARRTRACTRRGMASARVASVSFC